MIVWDSDALAHAGRPMKVKGSKPRPRPVPWRVGKADGKRGERVPWRVAHAAGVTPRILSFQCLQLGTLRDAGNSRFAV